MHGYTLGFPSPCVVVERICAPHRLALIVLVVGDVVSDDTTDRALAYYVDLGWSNPYHDDVPECDVLHRTTRIRGVFVLH